MSGPYRPAPGLDLNESRQDILWVSIILPYTLALVTVVLRFTSRRIARKGSWFDDWLMALAMMLATGILAGTATSIQQGLGLHIWILPSNEIASRAENVLLGLFELDNMYYACYGLAKMSILSLYYRNFKNRMIRRVIYVFILLVVLWIGMAICLTVLECSPISSFWLNPLGAYCPIPQIPLHVNLSIVSVVMNIMILFLPIPLFLDPEHTRLHRVILAFMFGFGLFVCVLSIVRTLAITYADVQSIDLFWNLANVWAWTAVEVQMAIVVANLPALGHVIARFVPSLKNEHLSPQHTGSTPEPRRKSGISTTPRLRRVTKNLPPPIDTKVGQFETEKERIQDLPPQLPVIEREFVRNVDHGISEWDYVPERRPTFDAQAARNAHPGTPVALRFNALSGISTGSGSQTDGNTAITWSEVQPRQSNYDSSRSQTLAPHHSPPNHTDSLGSDSALLPIQYLSRSNSSNVRSSDPRPNSYIQRSPPLPPPVTLSMARNQLRYSQGSQLAREIPQYSSTSSSDESSMMYGGRSRAGNGSWYKRGTATTPEHESSDEDAIIRRVSARYSVIPRYHVPSYAARYSVHSRGDEEESKPPLQPRNPRRNQRASLGEYRPETTTPEMSHARELTVTRAGPSTETTPRLLQGAFGHGTVPASVSRAMSNVVEMHSVSSLPFYFDIPRSVPDSSLMHESASDRSSALGTRRGHRSRGSLEEAELATAQLSAYAQSRASLGERYRHFTVAEEEDERAWYDAESELPSIETTPERPNEGRLRLPIRASVEVQHGNAEFDDTTTEDLEFEDARLERESYADSTDDERSYGHTPREDDHEYDRRSDLEHPQELDSREIPAPGVIHVLREVRVDNEHWSEMQARERLQRELDLAIEGNHEI